MLGTWQMDVALIAAVLALALLLFLAWRDLRTRQNHLEQLVEQWPNAGQIHEIRVGMARLEERMEATLKEAHASRQAVRRIEDYLLEAKRHHDSKL